MRRADLEIRNPAEIDAVLQEADVLRVAFCNGDLPYVVPVCFGHEPGRIYIHSAREGKKISALLKNPNCCFEADIVQGADQAENPCDWGMRYRSVIGYGTARILEDTGEIRHGLACIVAHYGGAPDRIPDKAHEMVAVIRIDISEMTGKKSE